MAKKGKDLFVLLGERRNPGSQKERQVTARGGWFRSLFQSVEPAAAGSGSGSKARAGKARNKTQTQTQTQAPRVPRGLLVPGWFVILLLLLGVCAGFVAGRWSVDAQDPLNLRVPNKGSVLPAPFPDREHSAQAPTDPRSEPGYLPPEKQAEPLSTVFFPLLSYPASQRDRAEALARHLRGQGLTTTRIRKVEAKDGSLHWLTLCYVNGTADGRYSEAHAKECYGLLKEVPLPKFEPRLARVVRQLNSAHDLKQFE